MLYATKPLQEIQLLCSLKYPPALSQIEEDGDGVVLAKWINGEVGSGVYTIDNRGEEGGSAVVQILDELRRGDAVEEVRKDVVKEFVRNTSVEAI